ncbi:PREDICTED: normal mucosa of esophagus-specific gene 1 protein isoform X1 [Ficedula albicollis]|uniref:normal mucosa of esophagus-specific gene 1 protein isoform X1 n=1 Tax=Ficedula albicollis TaxID=59894 RepID=UPI0007AD9427|nr:PREDICTED: normal mucosa of esophagus-specific gene 1 protein isoform X1 [Ficedula albicollis]
MSKGFWHTLKRQKELIPLLGILSMAATGAVSFCIYSLLNKSDVIIRKIGSSEPWEKVDPTKPQKVLLQWMFRIHNPFCEEESRSETTANWENSPYMSNSQVL